MPQPSIRLPWLQFPGRISQAEESGIRAYCAPSSFRTGGPLFRFSERQKEALRVGDAHDQDVVILRRHNDHVRRDRKSTRLNSSHVKTSYAVFCLNKKMTT